MTVSRLYTDYVLAPGEGLINTLIVLYCCCCCYYYSGTKGNISEMVSQIKTAFQERLSKNTFLDAVTIQRSIWKVFTSNM